MSREHFAITVDEVRLTPEELAAACAVSREWVIERVESGMLCIRTENVEYWTFGSRELMRARRLVELERDFDANPELAALMADAFEELERLRTRLRLR